MSHPMDIGIFLGLGDMDEVPPQRIGVVRCNRERRHSEKERSIGNVDSI